MSRQLLKPSPAVSTARFCSSVLALSGSHVASQGHSSSQLGEPHVVPIWSHGWRKQGGCSSGWHSAWTYRM